MRFMMIVKHGEKSGPPPKELMDAIAKAQRRGIQGRHADGRTVDWPQPLWEPASGFPVDRSPWLTVRSLKLRRLSEDSRSLS